MDNGNTTFTLSGDVGCSWSIGRIPPIPHLRTKPVRTPLDVASICADLSASYQKTFHLLTLDPDNLLINRLTLGIGMIVRLNPCEVFLQAVMDRAAAIVLVQNCPSGSLLPSPEDIALTMEVRKAGKKLRIRLLDHVLIGGSAYPAKNHFSLRQAKACAF
jgi:DNA repair protein RadC